MRFDKKRRRYVDDSGHILTPAEVRKHVTDYIDHQQADVKRKAEKLAIGALTVSAFFDFMRQKVTAWHALTGTIAYGGEGQMGREQWARINEKILSELSFLNQFEAQAEASFAAAETIAADVAASLEIPAGLETVVQERIAEALATAAPSEAATVARQAVTEALADSLGAEEAAFIAGQIEAVEASELIGGQIASRAQSYAGASFATFENNRMFQARDFGITLGRRDCIQDKGSCDECEGLATPDGEFIDIDEIPEIGDATCMSSCRCEISFAGAPSAFPDLGEHDAIFSAEHRAGRFGPGGLLPSNVNSEGRRN